MAISLVAETDALSNGTTATTAAINTTGANLIVLFMFGSAGTSPTDSKGNSWTASVFGASGYLRSYYCLDPIVGIGHTFTSPAPLAPIAVLAFSGVKIIGAPDATSGGTNSSGTVTPSVDDCLILTASGNDATGIPSGYTSTFASSGVPGSSYGISAAYKLQTTATAENPTWTGVTPASTVALVFQTAPPAYGSYDLLQITPGLRLESITWTGPVLRASFGSGYGAQALVGNASGLHRWSLHSGGIWSDEADGMQIDGVSRFEYYWEFFKTHTTGDTEIFAIQWRGGFYHVQFTDVEMSVEKFKNELIYQGGVEVVQRRVVGSEYNDDGSISVPAPPNPILTSLISWWKMDEASGNALDVHGVNDLTDNGGVSTGAGKVGNARTFATGDYFSLADNADLSTGDIDFTVCCWIKRSATTYQILLGKWNTSGQREYILFYNQGTGGVSFQVSNDGTANTTTDSAGGMSVGNWYFIVAWHDATANTINIQVNNATPVSVAHAGGGA